MNFESGNLPAVIVRRRLLSSKITSYWLYFMKKSSLIYVAALALLPGLIGCSSSEEKDRAKAEKVAALIDSIYVQSRTEKTDELCKKAKKAWDILCPLCYEFTGLYDGKVVYLKVRISPSNKLGIDVHVAKYTPSQISY